jgi:hypothetical protein
VSEIADGIAPSPKLEFENRLAAKGFVDTSDRVEE